MLQCQNETGITLSFRRSDSIHRALMWNEEPFKTVAYQFRRLVGVF